MTQTYEDLRKAYETTRKELDKTLGLSFCKLLELHPLYDHRVKQGNGDARLSVVLVGRGQPLELLRDKVLSNGQLLYTKLSVTVISDDPEGDMKKVMLHAPELYRFIRIRCKDKAQNITAQPEPEWDLGTLTYEWGALTRDNLRTILENHRDCTYFFFDETCTDMADICAEDRNRVVTCIRMQTEKQVMHGSRLTHQYYLHLHGTDACDLNCEPGDGYLDSIESVAYNLHYTYMKADNPHTTNEQILETFYEPYNYQSNIECAVHIRSKLHCCGITTNFDNVAAWHMAQKIKNDISGHLVERLAQLEHKRWCISKLVNGYSVPTDLNELVLRSLSGSTHDGKAKWHVCLVPYRITRPLTESDWTASNPDEISELDELDRMTLLVHNAWGLPLIGKDHIITMLMDRILTISNESSYFDQEIRMTLYNLNFAISQLKNGKTNALPMYRRAMTAWEEWRNRNYFNEHVNHAFMEIDDAMRWLSHHMNIRIAYITRRDYKETNRILIRQIPFALSKWKNLTLVKLLSVRNDICIRSAWEIEPEKLVFIDLVESDDDLQRFEKTIKQLDYFLKKNFKNLKVEYHFFVCANLQMFQSPDQPDKRIFKCHRIDSSVPDHIRREFVALMESCDADYIDVTDGNPELITVAKDYSRNSHIGSFRVMNSQIQNFYGADGLQGMEAKKGFSVENLFNLVGARKIRDNTEALTASIFQSYKPLWEIAKKAKDWYGFCTNFFAPVYRRALDDGAILSPEKSDIPKLYFEDQLLHLSADKVKEYHSILAALTENHLVSKSESSYTVCSQEVLAALRNSGKVLEYYIYCTAKTACAFNDVVMSWMFSHSGDENAAKNELDVICTVENTSLFISAKNVNINTIKQGNFLNYVCYEIYLLSIRFGINAKALLAAPNVPQFDDTTKKRSDKVLHAMSRGVYLLGDKCFESGRLGEVLDNIARGEENWCECLLDTAAVP